MAAVAVCGILSFVISLILARVIIRLCKRWALFDHPGPLKIHERPIPRLGGVAIIIAVSASSFSLLPSIAAPTWPFWIALTLVWVASLVDDIRNLSAFLRLIVQIGAALILWFSGWRVPLQIGSPSSAVILLSLTITCLFVVAMINSLNFLDGSDGIAAGVVAICAVAYFLLLRQHTNQFAAVIAMSAFGACTGFLLTNAPPAKLFLGDCGSATLGLLLAFWGLDYWRSEQITAAKMAVPVLICALPLLDAGLAIVRRLGNGTSPLYGDRAHIYDLMLARNLSKGRVALVCYAITTAFAAMAWWGTRSDSPRFWIAAGVSGLLFLAWAVKLGALRRTPVGETSPPQIAGTAISR